MRGGGATFIAAGLSEGSDAQSHAWDMRNAGPPSAAPSPRPRGSEGAGPFPPMGDAGALYPRSMRAELSHRSPPPPIDRKSSCRERVYGSV